jgi:pilus assembly protein Flp/PilA
MSNIKLDSLRAFLQNFAADERGATALEYGLLVALISISLIGAFSSFATNVRTMLYDKIIAALS